MWGERFPIWHRESRGLTGRAPANISPSYYFRNFFYDTSGPTHEAILACVAKMFGAEKIVFGTDYPFGLGQEGMQYIEHAVWTVEHSGLSEAELNHIFSQNARDGLKIDV